MKNKRLLIIVAVPTFFLLFLFWPYIIGTVEQPKRNKYRYRMLNAKFQSIQLQGQRIILVPRKILFVDIEPKDRVLQLAQGSTFELTDNRYWHHKYKVEKIEEDGVTLSYRDSERTFFPNDSVKLTWK